MDHTTINALLSGPDGRLYGTVTGGSRPALFVFDPRALEFTHFLQVPDDTPLDLGLQTGPDGNLYGFTRSTIYRLDPQSLSIDPIVEQHNGFTVAGPILGDRIFLPTNTACVRRRFSGDAMAEWKNYEELRPDQLEALIDKSPIAFWPLGLLEHHGWHLPIGFDGIKAQRTCQRIAKRTGASSYQPCGGAAAAATTYLNGATTSLLKRSPRYWTRLRVNCSTLACAPSY